MRNMITSAASCLALVLLIATMPGDCATAAPLDGAGCVTVIVWALEDCPSDIDGNTLVGTSDLLTLLACWGPVVLPGCARSNLVDIIGCPNPNGNSVNEVSVIDLLTLLADWTPLGGTCP